MNIVYSSDNNYARHLAESMVSIMENNLGEEKISFYILNVGLSDENIQKLTSLASGYGRNVYVVDFRNIKEKLGTDDVAINSFTIETYARLFLADALPETEDRAMWIDGDTAVLGSIHDMYYCDMGNNAIAAVVDQPSFGLDFSRNDAEIGDVPYFAAGMFVANLDIWRKEKITQQFIEYFKKRNGQTTFLEQSVMNHVLEGRVYMLDFKYHVITPAFFMNYKTMVKKWGHEYYSRESFVKGKRHPVIVHYAVFRPWKKWCLHPMTRHYRKYIRKTPYKDVPLENDGFFNTFGKVFISVKARIVRLFKPNA